MTPKALNTWLVIHKKRLIGSAIFTSNNSFISKVVSWASTWGKGKEEFIPSHVGSIIEKDGMLFVVDVKPPQNTYRPLINYLLYNSDDFILYLRNFDLDDKIFSKQLFDKVGELYPVFSAIRSVFTKRKTKYAQHCSEAWLRAVQLQGKFEHVNSEITPFELLKLLQKEG